MIQGGSYHLIIKVPFRPSYQSHVTYEIGLMKTSDVFCGIPASNKQPGETNNNDGYAFIRASMSDLRILLVQIALGVLLRPLNHKRKDKAVLQYWSCVKIIEKTAHLKL